MLTHDHDDGDDDDDDDDDGDDDDDDEAGGGGGGGGGATWVRLSGKNTVWLKYVDIRSTSLHISMI